MRLRWRFGLIAGLFLAIFSLYPQFKLLYLRVGEWNGHYAYNDVDEVAYASYLNALIDGRPRRNDPYTGRDDSPESPQPESLFSIQFAAPYTIALPARLFGMGAPWAMTISGALAAFLTAMAIFWLLGMITGDSLFAMAGSLAVLAGGAVFAGEGGMGELFGVGFPYPYFPGFRRYIPAMAFPAFFGFVGLVWKLLGEDEANEGRSPGRLVSYHWLGFATLASMVFGYSVFSYFYVWTTAAAWLLCLGVCILAVRPAGLVRNLKELGLLGIGCGAFLLPYAYLLANRSHTMDEVQMLVRTHAPDVDRPPELVTLIILILLAVSVLSGTISLRAKGTLFAISLAFTPIVVFNQQIITGQSLQPIHYQVFIGNYVAGLALFVTLGLIWREALRERQVGARAAAVVLTILAVAWGLMECHYTVRVLDDANVARDQALPVARRLTEIAKDDPERHRRTVLYLGINTEADDMPTVAPQSVLWARHQHVFAGITWQENKERYYQQLYYEETDPDNLAGGMKSGYDFVSMIALFGWGRHTDRLNAAHEPLTFVEIDAEAGRFAKYAVNFDARGVAVPRLDYLVTRIDNRSFANVDKWYERDAGEHFGEYVLYRLKLR
ncbi:MAG: hypothetical protein ABR530_10985 [Pyrinomonadaceae bacterium]